MPRISDLTRVNEVSDGDVFPIEQASSGRTRSVAFKTIRDDISADVDAAVSIAVAAAAAAEQAAASSDAQVLRDDLADGATALKGADLVAYDAGETVRDAIAASKQFDADLSNTSDPALGAAIVGRGVVAVDSIADLLALPESARREDLRYLVKGYHAGSDVGGGVFAWVLSTPKSNHNGGTIIDPGKNFPSNWGSGVGLDDWFSSAAIGSGCFVKGVGKGVTVTDFGGIGDYDGINGFDNRASLQAALNSSKHVSFGGVGRFRVAGPVGIDNGTSLYQKDLFVITSEGASLVLDSAEAVFTSSRALVDPESTANLFTAKILFKNLIVEQASPSVMVNGDRLYNSGLVGCSVNGVTTVVKSFRPAAAPGHPQGYLQSFFLNDNQFSGVGKVIDAKKAYNITVDRNAFEACTAGVYIDGDGDPAINCIRLTKNVFEGGGLFAKLGAVLAGDISGNYFEGNTAGDAASDKLNCQIYAMRVGSGGYHKGLNISENGVQAVAAQVADIAYADYKLTQGASDIAIHNCFSNGSRLTNLSLSSAEGSWMKSNSNSRVGKSANECRVHYATGGKVFSRAAHFSDALWTVAEIDVSEIKRLLSEGILAASEAPAVFDLDVLASVRSSGGIAFSNLALKFMGVVGHSSEGLPPSLSVSDVYVGVNLLSVVEIPTGLDIDTSGRKTRSWFLGPALTVARVGDVYKLRISGFADYSYPDYGSPQSIISSATLTIKSRNNSASRFSALRANV